MKKLDCLGSSVLSLRRCKCDRKVSFLLYCSLPGKWDRLDARKKHGLVVEKPNNVAQTLFQKNLFLD